MSQEPVWAGGAPRMSASRETARSGANLADILERVLDKGIVIAGDIRIDLLDIELLTIKIRLLVASVDRAREMGIDWWEHDPALSSGSRDVIEENERLRRRIGELESGRTSGAALDGEAEQHPAEQRPPERQQTAEQRPTERHPTEHHTTERHSAGQPPARGRHRPAEGGRS